MAFRVKGWRESYSLCMAYPLPAAQERLVELVAEARDTHRAVTISEHGKVVAALISVDDLAELEDKAALAEHLADKAAGRGGLICPSAMDSNVTVRLSICSRGKWI